MTAALEVRVRRGRTVEAVHRVSAVLVGPEGTVYEQVGEDLITTWRSGAKPLQLEVTAGHVDAPLRVWDLAIGASSHSAQPLHVARVRDLMMRLGVEMEDLFCGAHRPIHAGSADAMVRIGEEPCAVHNNCSGKHTFMAAACKRHGWPKDYRDPDHPLQRRIRAQVEHRAGRRTEVVVDGCGVPCFVLKMSAMARAYASLTAEEHNVAARIVDAMTTHPLLVSGEGRDDCTVAISATRPTVAKVGAAGLMNIGLVPEQLGLVIKVHSGDGDARAVATASVLTRWLPGLLPDGAMAKWRVLNNVAGRVVGDRVAVWQ